MNWNGLELPPSYYQDDAVYIIHADCRDVLPRIPDKSIDLVLTDPPYNVGIKYGEADDNLNPIAYAEFIRWLVNETIRTADGNIALVLGSKPLKVWWDHIPEAKLIIVKMGAISNNKIKGLHLQFHPLLSTVKSNQYMSDLWEDIRWPGEGYYFNEDRYGHPAMTPTKLARRLVSLFSTDGRVILEPFMGCGTMAIASKVLGRRCIGIEIEEKYCEIAAKRCSQSVMRLEV